MRRSWFLCLGLAAGAALAADPPADYLRDVHPVLAAKCFSCHSGDKRFANLSLATYRDVLRGGRTGKVVNPGSSGDSLLVHRVLGDGVPIMPPAGEKLTPAEIARLRAWIDQGARETPSSAAARPNWVPPLGLACAPSSGDSLEELTRQYFRARNTPLPDPAGDEVFLRRVYLDLWGLLPSPEEQEAFLSDRSPDRRARLVDHLLADRHKYAGHWISWWNDLLRNDEGVNYAGARKSITEWLYPALVENLAYDEFARRLLNPWRSGDPDGFLLGVNWRGDVSASQTPVMQAAQNSAQIFLGVNLKCNSCHDSFVSKWKLKDAYGLATFFTEGELEMVRCDARTGQMAKPEFLYPELGGVDPQASLGERRLWAAALFTSPDNGRFARTIVNRVWHKLLGRGIVEPVDDMDAEPWSPAILDALACEFRANRYDLKWLIRRIVLSRAYQLPAVDPPPAGEEMFIFRGPLVRRMTAEQFADAVGAMTGEWHARIAPRSTVAELVREWRLASSPLTRALGRPIRDQVFTERDASATTLQALELTNGETYMRLLRRASRRMLDQLPPAPANLFDSGRVSGESVPVDLNITGLKQLRLIVYDVDSYSPERVQAVWANARLAGPDGETPLGQPSPGKMKNLAFARAIRVKTPSEFVINLEGKNYTRFRAVAGVEEESLASDINPRIRFFIFSEPPDMERLVRVEGAPPVTPPEGPFTPASLTLRLFRHALGRPPQDREADVARQLLAGPGGKPRADGVADLLWALTMLPEFQLIR